MNKSKIVKVNEKIAQKVTTEFKKISKAAVDGQTSINDKFVERYLAKDGESVNEAKERLEYKKKVRLDKKEARKNQHKQKIRAKKNY